MNKILGMFAAAMALVASTAAMADTTFRVHNDMPGGTITEVHATAVTDRSYGQDLLGSSVIDPGDYETLAPEYTRGCYYDIKIVVGSGRGATISGINLCTTSGIRFLGWRGATPLYNRY